ncbi:MAG: hypothetical protein HRT45_11675 [Bdellovibrionales bacterium]|nr:hypothetical protein [Bdellovibrionales bacterium]
MTQPDLWIVEVRGQKMGPMETLQIVEGLLSRQLRVVNRVSRDGNNFKAICNEEYFEEFIIKLIEKLTPLADKEVALKQLEDTNKEDFSELSGVHKIDVTSLGITEQLEHAKQLQRASADLSGLRKILIDIRTNRKVIIQAQTHVDREEIHPDDKDVYIDTGPTLNPLKGGNKYILGTFVVVAIVFFGIDYQKRQAYLAEQAELEKEQEAKISSKYLGGGGGGVAPGEEKDDSALIKMVTDLLKLPPKNAVGVQGYLEMSSYIANANSAVIDGVTVSRAEAKQTFSQLMDRATTRILKDEVEKAEELLLYAIKIPFQSKVNALLMLMNVAHKIDLKTGSKRFVRVQSVLTMVDRYERVDPKVKGKDKLSFVRFLGNHYLENQVGVNTSFRQFLKHMPEVGYGSSTLTSWESLLADCVNVYNSRRSDAWANAMLTGCLLRTSKADKASAYANYAVGQLPNEEDIVAIAGLAFLKTGDRDRAKQELWKPIKVKKAQAALRFAGRKQYCESYEKDSACASRESASLFPPEVRKRIRKSQR